MGAVGVEEAVEGVVTLVVLLLAENGLNMAEEALIGDRRVGEYVLEGTRGGVGLK